MISLETDLSERRDLSNKKMKMLVSRDCLWNWNDNKRHNYTTICLFSVKKGTPHRQMSKQNHLLSWVFDFATWPQKLWRSLPFCGISVNQFRVFPSAWPTRLNQTHPLLCWNKVIFTMFRWLHGWQNVATCMLGQPTFHWWFVPPCPWFYLSWANDRKTCTEAQTLHPQVN